MVIETVEIENSPKRIANSLDWQSCRVSKLYRGEEGVEAWNYTCACTEKFGENILVRGEEEPRLERVIDRNRDNVPCLIAATSVICLRYTRSVHLNTSVEIVFPQPTEQCLRKIRAWKPRIIIRQPLYLPILYQWLKFWSRSLLENSSNKMKFRRE